MATAAVTTTQSPLALRAIFKPFVAFGAFLVRMSEDYHRAAVSNQLLSLTDAELEAKGLTREDVVRDVMSGKYGI